MPGTLTVSGMSAGLASGQKTIGPVTMVGNNTVGQISDATLTTGDNDFAVPVGASAVAVFLGTGATVTITLRTNLNMADEGTPIGGSGFAVIPLVTGVTTVILHCTGSLPGVELSFV